MHIISLLLILATPPLPNGGFEAGLTGWTVTAPHDGMVQTVPAARSIGRAGLRLVDDDPKRGVVMISDRVPATPGQIHRLVVWGRQVSDKPVSDVVLRYRDAAGKELAGQRWGRYWTGASIRSPGWFERSIVQTIAPAGAVEIFVRVATWGSGIGTADIDDLQLTDVTAEPEKYVPVLPAELPQRDAPAKIVLKLDDLVNHRDGVHPGWQKVADFLAARELKAGFGIIGNSLEGDTPKYYQWLRDHAASGFVEYWHHGYDHKEWTAGETKLQEFKGTPAEHQREHLSRPNALLKERIGLTMTVFGAPFNGTDETTVAALADDPDIKVWLFGNEATPAGKTVLTRTYCADLEQGTFVPNAPAFKDGYVHNPGREYFVLQGHPTHWPEERWANFVAIIDFLQQQGAEFVFASELAGPVGAR